MSRSNAYRSLLMVCSLTLVASCGDDTADQLGPHASSAYTVASAQEVYGLVGASLLDVELLPARSQPGFDWTTELYEGSGYRLLVAIGPETERTEILEYSAVDEAVEVGTAQVVGVGSVAGHEVAISMYGEQASIEGLKAVSQALTIATGEGSPHLVFPAEKSPTLIGRLDPQPDSPEGVAGPSMRRVYAMGSTRSVSVVIEPSDRSVPLELAAGATPFSVMAFDGVDRQFVAFPPPASDMGWVAATMLGESLVTISGASDLAGAARLVSQLSLLADGGASEEDAMQLARVGLRSIARVAVGELNIEYRGPDGYDRMVLCAGGERSETCAIAKTLSTFALLPTESGATLVGAWPVAGAQPAIESTPTLAFERVTGDGYVVVAANVDHLAGATIELCMTVESVPKQCADIIVGKPESEAR